MRVAQSARSTTSVAPSTAVTRTWAPEGRSGPLTFQRLSPTLTQPRCGCAKPWRHCCSRTLQYSDRPRRHSGAFAAKALHKLLELRQRQRRAEIVALHVTTFHIAQYLKLASGFCPVARCLEAGINVALGTDGAASNNDLDMLGEMRTAALLAKGVGEDASSVPAFTALQMATLNGARALGLENETGSLTLGKFADITAIHLDELECQPLYNPISQIVYAANRQQVTDVWVAGKQLLKQRNLTTFNIDELRKKVNHWKELLQS